MTFEEAFLKSARYYFKGKSFAETDKVSPNRKYTKEYLDQMEKEFLDTDEQKEVKDATKSV
jgi:hypothetical protein